VDPALKGQIDRHGGSPDGASRYLIGPYIYYRTEQDLLPFHQCATDKTIPRELYHACFVVRDDPAAGGEPVADEPASAGDATEPSPPSGPAPGTK
jgi:hypothetical protein